MNERRRTMIASRIRRTRKQRSHDFVAVGAALTMATMMTMIVILSSQHLMIHGFIGMDRSSSSSSSHVLHNDKTKSFCTENRHHHHHILNSNPLNHIIRSTNLFSSPQEDSDRDEDGYQDTATKTTSFLLPIFPLRKRVRFPSDQLTLNLYEPRYIAMCDYILRKPDITNNDKTTDDLKKSNHKLFGAIYTANKPQIVPQSSGPIVPVLSKGDIGTLCVIFDHLERTAKTGGQQNENDGRKIRLNAVGVCRFRIEEIVQDGTAGFGDGDDKDALLGPFILVRASIVHDSYDIVDQDDLFGRSSGLLEKLDGRLASERQLDSSRPENGRDDVVETAEEYVDWICGLGKSVISQTEKLEEDEWVDKGWEDLYKAEIISFLVASTWMNNNNNGRNTGGSFVGKQQQQLTVSPIEMTKVLKSTSTKERIEYLEQTQSLR